MRIALAHKLFRLTGGVDVFFRETERVVRENGNETLMIATGEPEDIEGISNALLLKAPDYKNTSNLKKLLNLSSAIYDRSKKDVIKSALSEFSPDVLHIFAMNVHLSPSILTAATELDIPIVGTFNDYKHICPNYKLFYDGNICFDCKGGSFYKASINKCCKNSRALSIASSIEAYVHEFIGVYEKFDHFTFSSNFLADTTREFWSGRNISWSRLLNPFDSVSFEPSPIYDDYGLYFGRLIDEKGVDRLIEASGLIDGFPIKIIGDGPDLDALRKRTERLGLTNVEFLGPMWGEALNTVLERARFVVVPSIWHENFPYVINQSFALARPVIGARRGGIPELVIHEERGLIFDPDDIQELAAMMMRLIEDTEDARRMGQQAKRWSDDTFRDEIAYSDLQLAYKAAISAHSSNRR